MTMSSLINLPGDHDDHPGIPAFLSASAPFSTSSQVSGRMRRKSRCSMDLCWRHRWHPRVIPRWKKQVKPWRKMGETSWTKWWKNLEKNWQRMSRSSPRAFFQVNFWTPLRAAEGSLISSQLMFTKNEKMIWNCNLSVSSCFHVYFYFGLFSCEMFCPFDLQRSLQLTTAV